MNINTFIKATTFSFLFIFTIAAKGQSNDRWVKGEVDLVSGKTIRGNIQFDLETNELLVITNNQKAKLFTSVNVESFQVIDDEAEMSRYFFSLPYKVEKHYEKNIFFELLSEGHITLLSRSVWSEVPVYYQDPNGMVTNTYSRSIVLEQFYFILEDGEIITSEPTIKDLLANGIFPEIAASDITSFVKRQKLKIHKRVDMITLINFYNRNRTNYIN